MKWLVSAAKSVAGFVVPGLGPALKWGPWIAIAVLFGLLMIERTRLGEAQAQTVAEAARVGQAVSQCQAEAAQQAATESAASVAQIQRAQAAASSAEVQLFTQRQVTKGAQDAAQQQLGTALAAIATQAAQPGQDGPIPPVLAEMFP